MNLTAVEKEGRLHIAVRLRRIDAINATIFKDRLRGMIETSGMPVVLDMRQVSFMDSSGLGALIAVQNTVATRLELQNLAPEVARVFRVTGMNAIFDGVPEED